MPHGMAPPGVRPRRELASPLFAGAARVMLLGSGEIGREIALEAMRMGAEVVAVDRYAGAPAMQVAHRHHVVPMTDGRAVRALVKKEAPDLIVPEIEQIDTHELLRLEEEGWVVIPRAEATLITMDRERIRRLAAEAAGVKTSRYEFANNLDEAKGAAEKLGYPCLFKSMMSSSGLGSSLVKEPAEVADAYGAASREGRVRNHRVMIEEFVRFDLEITQLTLRHYDAQGHVATSFCPPIGHTRPGTHYHESWQPTPTSESLGKKMQDVAKAVTDRLGGIGIFGCEQFLVGDEVYFSEISPRPHDTGLVTLASQWQSEFALHARAILGFPVPSIEMVSPAAAHVILASGEGWAPAYGGLWDAHAIPGVRIHLFGKPQAYRERRMGIALAQASDVDLARDRAMRAAHLVEERIRFPEPIGPAAGSPPDAVSSAKG